MSHEITITDEEIAVLRDFINSSDGPLALKMLFWAAFSKGLSGLAREADELIEKFFKDDPQKGEIFKAIIRQDRRFIKV